MALHAPQIEHRTGLARLLWDRRIEQTALAAALNPPVHQSTVTRWCKGERTIPPRRIEEIAALLGVKPEELS